MHTLALALTWLALLLSLGEPWGVCVLVGVAFLMALGLWLRERGRR
jgi:hypothetical protein